MINKKQILKASAVIVAVVMVVGFLISAILFSSMKIRAIAPPVPPKVFGYSTTARGMCTMDLSTGRILYEHNADARLPLASTTKIVTAITAIEAYEECGKSLDEKIKIEDKAIGIEGTSIYLKKGEQLTPRELLFGLMLRSGNDAACAIALSIKPTIAEFAALMNRIAARVGANNSNFKNPHGLDEDGHYVTARDLAKITAYAMKNPTFAEIVKTKQIRIDGAEYPRVLHNKNRLLKSLPGCVGVKTGFTKKAGRCFVSALEANGQTAICAVLNCGPMFEEASALMTSAVKEFPMRKIIAADEFIEFTENCKGENCEDGICAIATEDFYYPLSDEELNNDINISLSGEEVKVTLKDKEIYKAQCNVL